jgi:dynactin 1
VILKIYLSVSGTAPWIARVDEIKAALSVNVEAERKVAQLNDEIQALARNVKTKDQTIQESSVRIELMERRLEVIKRQADTILDLENKLVSAKKDAKKFREDMESLQIELEMEQKNAKTMAMAAGQENQGEFFSISQHPYTILIELLAIGAQPVEPDNMPIEGSLETSHLLEQVRLQDAFFCVFIIIIVLDCCFPWNCTFPQNGKFIPQGSRFT